MKWFTSDQHFFHENIIEYCDRPFDSLEEMHETIIDQWNVAVKPGDEVYVLGDFAITWNRKDTTPVEAILKRLNGQKQLIKGNHDRRAVLDAKGWSWVGDCKEIKEQGQRIVLLHYAMRSWSQSHRGSWQLYGHSHGMLPPVGKQLDVGVDCNDFTPISFDQIKDRLGEKETCP